MTDQDHLAQIADMRRKKIVALEAQLKAWREVAEQLVQLAMDGTHLLDEERAALARLHRLKTDL
jgi:ribosomal protein L17